MRELPEGWIEASVAQVSDDISYGYTASAIQEPNGPKYLRITDIQNGVVNWETVPYCSIPENKISNYELKSGDLVFARTGATTGKSFLIRACPVTVFASYLIRVRHSSNILPEFIASFFQSKSYWDQISENVSGSAQPNCNATKLSSLVIPLPPLAEQRRIVAKLNPLIGSIEAYQQRMAKIPVILKRFRQAVLAAACAGRLTAKWREEYADVGPVFPLLQGTDTDNRNEIPETWAIVSVGDTISGLKYGTSQKCSYEKGGTPVLRIPNIGEGVIDQSDLKYADLPDNELEQLKLHPGDVLLIRSNGSVSLVGRAALVRDSEKGFAYAGYLIRLRPNTSRILPPYLNLVLGIRDVRLQIEIPARSTSGVNNINSDEVKSLKIPLPPIAEQAEIVRHVETLFKLADQIEARYQRTKPLVDKLPQSILAKAFRGELVPTEAELAHREGRDYEPASVLLERVRSERADHAQGRKEKARSQPSRARLARGAKPRI